MIELHLDLPRAMLHNQLFMAMEITVTIWPATQNGVGNWNKINANGRVATQEQNYCEKILLVIFVAKIYP